MESEIFSISIKLLLLLIVPMTALVVLVSLITSSFFSVVKIQDFAIQYTIKLISVVVVLLVIFSASSSFFIKQVEQLYMLSF